MSDLISFVHARLDEREATARRAARESDGERWSRLQFRNGLPDVAEHAAAYNPAYVLRDIAAKRAILDLHPHERFAALPDHWPDHWKAETKQAFPDTDESYVACKSCNWDQEYEVVEPGWWCETVRHLAAIDADHPDYNPEWRFT